MEAAFCSKSGTAPGWGRASAGSGQVGAGVGAVSGQGRGRVGVGPGQGRGRVGVGGQGRVGSGSGQGCRLEDMFPYFSCLGALKWALARHLFYRYVSAIIL